MEQEFIVPILVATLPPLFVQIFAMLSSRAKEKDRLKKLQSDIAELMLKITRVEIMALCDHDREGTEITQLLALYDKYKQSGGNSYIDSLVNKKRKQLHF